MSSTVPYSKPWLSYADQINLLQRRGLIITDHTLATEHLERIGYYRLRGYLYPFRTTVITQSNQIEVRDQFKSGTSFSDVAALYVFDKSLRLLLMDALERIEIALRAKFAYILGRHDPLGYLDPAFYDSENVSFSFIDFSQNLDRLITKSKSECIVANVAHYGTILPIWIACQAWDFGTVKWLFKGLKAQYKTEISNVFGVKRPSTFESWLLALNYLRNICAHHGRLWNLNIICNPSFKGTSLLLKHPGINRNRCFALICVISYLLGIVCPRTRWDSRLNKLIQGFPDLSHIQVAPYENQSSLTIQAAGFPKDWSGF